MRELKLIRKGQQGREEEAPLPSLSQVGKLSNSGTVRHGAAKLNPH